MNALDWKKDYEEFDKVTREFYAGEISAGEYKGFSGGFGSYAQRGGKASMLRLRFPGGKVTKEKLKFVAEGIKKYQINKIHFTTCQTIQLHNLHADAVCDLAVKALDYGIVTRGGGGDFPRNVMVSPLSGVEKGEYFDVSPYAEAASDYLMSFIKKVKLPRKLKVAFSNSPANRTHATFRDLGFAANADGTFDVYSAGGLGNHPKMGVLVAKSIKPNMVLYYIKAMVDMFTTYGNYENRAKARTRYMQDVLGNAYTEKFQEKLNAVLENGENLSLDVIPCPVTKTGDGSTVSDARIISQKQESLYAVEYHPIGGCPSSCGTHQIGRIGFRGAVRRVDGVPTSAFLLYVNGKEEEKARFGEEVGTILEEQIPLFVKALGDEISASGMDFEQWYEKNPSRLKEIAEPFI